MFVSKYWSRDAALRGFRLGGKRTIRVVYAADLWVEGLCGPSSGSHARTHTVPRTVNAGFSLTKTNKKENLNSFVLSWAPDCHVFSFYGKKGDKGVNLSNQYRQEKKIEKLGETFVFAFDEWMDETKVFGSGGGMRRVRCFVFKFKFSDRAPSGGFPLKPHLTSIRKFLATL